MNPMSSREPGTRSSNRNADSTVVGRSASLARHEPASAGTPQDARASRHMLGVSFLVACALGLTAAIFFQLVLNMMGRQTQLAANGSRTECEEGEALGCPTGTTCSGGSCVAVPALDTCQVGDSCEMTGASCRCQAPLRCQANVCTADLITASCDDPIVHKVLVEVQKTCQGSWNTCPEDKLKDFVLSSADFDQVIAAFPGTMTIHFPSGRPFLAQGRDWPGDDERAYYRKQLSTPAVAKALGEAQDLLLIGRSSLGQSPDEDLRYSRARVNMVAELLTAAAPGPNESTALRGKFRQLMLGSRKVLQPAFFAKNYANRIVAWSADAEQYLRSKLVDLAKLSAKERRGILGMVNQVVFVVPIPCKLPVDGATAGATR